MKIYLSLVLLLVCVPAYALPKVYYAFHKSPPYREVADDGTLRGMDLEIMTLLAERMQFELKPIRCPLSRCLVMLEKGELDLATGLLKTAERAQYVDYIEPPYYRTSTAYSFYRRADNPLVVNNFNDLHGKSIALIRGGKYFPEFDNDSSLTKIPMLSEVEQIKILLKGRVDLMITVNSTMHLSLERMGVVDQVSQVNYQEQQVINAYMALSKKTLINYTADDFSAALQALHESGELDAILTKYGIIY